MELSVVIPVLNEAAKIGADLEATARFFMENALNGEILISDDGSTDSTAAVVRTFAQTSPVPVHWLSEGRHLGKGAAVRRGMLASRGEIVAFMDSGLCVPLRFLKEGMDRIRRQECDIVHGSRHLAASRILRPQTLSRRWSARFFRLVTRVLLPPIRELTDTQCGFKLYRGDIARRLYASSKLNGFLFDIELVLLARQQGYRICEMPIEWRSDPDSRLSLSGSWRSVLGELLRLRKRF